MATQNTDHSTATDSIQSKTVWEVFHGNHIAGGNRDVLIIVSVENSGSQNPDVVPRCEIEITEEDRRKLTNQGIPPECSDDLSIIRARISLDSSLDLVRELRAEPGKELGRGYILEQIQDFLKSSKKTGGVVYYIGNGKRNTGDWCFSDGFVTFRDIAACYDRFFHGRLLTIVSDCSYSGNWAKACSQYLEEQGVQPCGHSADKKGILLKVYTSCKPTEVAATRCFSVRCVMNDKNNGTMYYYTRSILRATQHSYGIDFTKIQCAKKFEEPCALSPECTWHKWLENQRVYLVRGSDHGRPAWHYVLLVDDEETIKIFKEKTQGEAAGTETIDISNFGQVIKSGWGKEPPNQVRDWIDKNYTNSFITS